MKKIFVIATIFVLVCGVSNALAQFYQVVDLGTLGGSWSEARAINDIGQVVGTSGLSTPFYHAFVYEGGSMIDLGALNENNNSSAYGINNSGQIVGYSSNAANDGHAFIYENSTMTDMGVLTGSYSSSYSINNNGVAVGGSGKAFVFENGSMSALLDINSAAFDINNAGQVVGKYSTGPYMDPFLIDNGQFIPLGNLGGLYSYARAINDAGQIVGTSGINTSNPLQYHAFTYLNDTLIDLNTLIPIDSVWILEDAYDINNKGQIVGYGQINGQKHAFLATPVPLPSAIWLLGSGLVGLAGFRRKKFKK
jgi:probable HAF family extracellular repeat protein